MEVITAVEGYVDRGKLPPRVEKEGARDMQRPFSYTRGQAHSAADRGKGSTRLKSKTRGNKVKFIFKNVGLGGAETARWLRTRLGSPSLHSKRTVHQLSHRWSLRELFMYIF